MYNYINSCLYTELINVVLLSCKFSSDTRTGKHFDKHLQNTCFIIITGFGNNIPRKENTRETVICPKWPALQKKTSTGTYSWAPVHVPVRVRVVHGLVDRDGLGFSVFDPNFDGCGLDAPTGRRANREECPTSTGRTHAHCPTRRADEQKAESRRQRQERLRWVRSSTSDCRAASSGCVAEPGGARHAARSDQSQPRWAEQRWSFNINLIRGSSTNGRL